MTGLKVVHYVVRYEGDRGQREDYGSGDAVWGKLFAS